MLCVCFLCRGIEQRGRSEGTHRPLREGELLGTVGSQSAGRFLSVEQFNPHPRHERLMDKIPTPEELIAHKESGWFEGKRYNVGQLYIWASERFPVEEVAVPDLQDQISNLDFDAKSFSGMDADKPILLTHTGHIIDGNHRAYKATSEQRQTIRAIRLPEELPLESEMEL